MSAEAARQRPRPPPPRWRCDSALPAADFEALLVRPSRSVDDAFDAAFRDVSRSGVPVWESALPAAPLDLVEVEPLVSVFDAVVAAFLPVSLDMRTPGGSWSSGTTVPPHDAIREPPMTSRARPGYHSSMSSLPIVPHPADRPPRAGAAAPDAPPPVARPDLADADLHPLLVAFYASVERDPALAPYFADLDMVAHIPRIADFWSTMLFHSGRYAANAFAPHARMPGLTADHFARWVATFERTVDARHAGPVAERAKDLAHRIAYSMQLRLGITPFAEFRQDAV